MTGVTKNKEPHTLPLSDTLTQKQIQAIHNRVALAETRLVSPYVFPGEGKTGYIVEPKRAIDAVTAATGITFSNEALPLHCSKRQLDTIPSGGIFLTMAWKVTLHRKVDKELASLPVAVQKHVFRLVFEIELLGPVRGNWANYGKLDGNKHHCHLKKGRPTYVAVWTEDKENITVEVIYAGTHEKAPY